MLDVAVIGAGPVGLACAIEAKRANLSAVVVEKGSIVNSLVGYPTQMEFFSTPNLIEIGGHPFTTRRYKPIREEALDYYAGVATAEDLKLSLFNRVRSISGTKGSFELAGDSSTISARRVIVATGFFDVPIKLEIPGEDLSKVTHYYKEPYRYFGQRVAIIGNKNSAAKAALDCHRHHAEVTLIVRDEELSSSIKYWLKPDLQNRIDRGEVRALFEAVVTQIDEKSITVNHGSNKGVIIENDFVLAMTGYKPDYPMLSSWQIEFDDDVARTPHHDASTFESSRPGIYLAGTVCGGLHTSRWFIENGREHAAAIIKHISAGLKGSQNLPR